MPETIYSLRPRLLGTNHVPSPEEFNLIRNIFVPFHEDQIRALNVQVDEAQAASAALLRRVHEEQLLLEAHKALLSPMRRLIPDILLEIFHHYHSDCLEAPMHLMKVCRKWRDLVLSTPTLWNIVMLHDAMPTRKIVPFARACVKYSASCPIKVVLKFMRLRSNSYLLRQALYDAVDILAEHIHRWQIFEVFLDRMFRPDNGSFNLPLEAPLLKKLVLAVEIPWTFELLHLPRLRHLKLPMIRSEDVPLLLQCTDLRSLTLNGKSGDLTLMDCWTLLSNCPDIETIDLTSIVPGGPLPEKELTLPHLRELRLGPYTPDPAPLIHYIKPPGLQRLRILVGKGTEFDASCITRLMHKCRPPLTTLSLVNMDGAAVASCLPILSHLTSLSLQHTNALDVVLHRLTELDNDGNLHCPALMYLGLRLCLFTGADLVCLARERQKAAGGLRVRVDKNTRYKPEEFTGLTIDLSLVGEFSDSELKELYDLQT